MFILVSVVRLDEILPNASELKKLMSILTPELPNITMMLLESSSTNKVGHYFMEVLLWQ